MDGHMWFGAFATVVLVAGVIYLALRREPIDEDTWGIK